jgi:hypothetical protein
VCVCVWYTVRVDRTATTATTVKTVAHRRSGESRTHTYIHTLHSKVGQHNNSGECVCVTYTVRADSTATTLMTMFNRRFG